MSLSARSCGPRAGEGQPGQEQRSGTPSPALAGSHGHGSHGGQGVTVTVTAGARSRRAPNTPPLLQQPTDRLRVPTVCRRWPGDHVSDAPVTA